MLRSFTFRNFKSLHDVTLSLADVSLLIGWNASGKSNVLEAIELLCWTARAPRLSDLAHAMDREQVRLRGNLDDLSPFGSEGGVMEFDCVIEDDDDGDRFVSERIAGAGLGTLTLELGLRLSGRGLSMEREQLRSEEIEARGFTTPLYRAETSSSEHSHTLQITYQNYRRATKPKIDGVDDQPAFVQLTTPARFPERYEETRETVPVAARRVRDVLGQVRFLDPSPGSMRGYSFRDDEELHLNGDNVSAVLAHLGAQGRMDEVLAFVGELPEKGIERIGFLKTPRNEVMVTARETFGNRSADVPAALMSDGTLRVLAIAAALLAAPRGSLVVIEEIDNGVHPSRAGHLLTAILNAARRRGIRVLITTHNPALQDALPDDVLPAVTLAMRDPETGATQLRRLADLPSFPRIAGAGPLGRLVTGASFERLVKPAEPGPAGPPDLGWLFGKAGPK
jgi:predicted ATPase